MILTVTVTYFIFLAVRKQLQNLKAEISQQSKRNFELDRDVRFFDQRIALLINHRISVEVKICYINHLM
jgi:Ras GTPase-activating-like protein IQGAP2/3